MKTKLSKISLLLSSIALFFGLLVGIKPSSVTPVNAVTTTRCGVEAEWQGWSNPSKLPSSSGYYYLTTDVTCTKTIMLDMQTIMHLDLNGKTVTFDGKGNFTAITINNSFNLYDSKGQGKITQNPDSTYYGAFNLNRYGEFNMYGGTITGFINNKRDGGAVSLPGDTCFNMYGGCIENCSTAYCGGAVYGSSSTAIININGGTIGQNSASEDGSGIYAYSCPYTISKGRFCTENSYVPSLSGKSTIIFDPNGGEGGIYTMEATWGENLNSISVPTRIGCTFDGYYNAKIGGDKYFNADGTVTERTGDGQKWDYIGPVTLYGHWINPLEDFSQEFIDSTDGFCNSKINVVIQSNLKASFDKLPEENQTIFKNTVPQIPYVDSDIVVNAKSRYCYMISELGYDDFLKIFNEEELKALRSRGTSLSFFSDSIESLSTILIISLVVIGFITLSGYLVLKKKENRQ